MNRIENNRIIWGTPLPLIDSIEELEILPKFPIEALPSKVSTYCKYVADSVQADVNLIGSMVLSVLSLCAKGKAKISSEGTAYTEPLNLYIIGIAPPGSRKSGVFSEITAPINMYENRVNEIRKPKIATYYDKIDILEEQKNEIKKNKSISQEDKERKLEPINRQLETLKGSPLCELSLYTNNATVEAFEDEAYSQGGQYSILADEGGILSIIAGLYSSGKSNIDFFKCGYDNTIYRKQRKGTSIVMKSPNVSIGLLTQQDVVDNMLENKQFMGEGLTQRFLFADIESNVGKLKFHNMVEIPTAIKVFYDETIERLLQLPTLEEPPILKMDNEALALANNYFDKIQEELSKGKFSYNNILTEWGSKHYGKTMRIAGILHLCEHNHNEMVNAQTVLNAIKIADFFTAHSIKQLNRKPGEADCGELGKLLKRLTDMARNKPQHMIPFKLINNYIGRTIPLDTIREQLQQLQDKNYIFMIYPRTSTGKTSKNPNVYLSDYLFSK